MQDGAVGLEKSTTLVAVCEPNSAARITKKNVRARVAQAQLLTLSSCIKPSIRTKPTGLISFYEPISHMMMNVAHERDKVIGMMHGLMKWGR